MGVRGLTSLLQSVGILPSSSKPSSSKPSSSKPTTNHDEEWHNKSRIVPGSLLAIDGSGLIFYIYQQTYYQHYYDMIHLQHKENPFDDEIHFIKNLIPSILPFKKIKTMTKYILDTLVYIHDINLKIYLDGDISRMKVKTKRGRSDKIRIQNQNLRNFFQRNNLPRSFEECCRKNAQQNVSYKNNNNVDNDDDDDDDDVVDNFHLPSPDIFLEEFPIPNRLFDEIIHVIDEYIQSHDMNVNSTRIVRLIQCDEEADRYVALQSAADFDNMTYAVGNDFDFMLYGSPGTSVLYVPLNSLDWDNNNNNNNNNDDNYDDDLRGIVVTRKQVANYFGITEKMFIEASIAMGND